MLFSSYQWRNIKGKSQSIIFPCDQCNYNAKQINCAKCAGWSLYKNNFYYLANNSLHFELTVALSRTRLSASDNKESMEGPGAQSNNKQQFNDCHDGSPGTGQMKGQPPMSRPRQPPHSTAALWSGSRLRGLILFLFVFDLWLIRWLLASSRPARLCLNTDTGIKTQMWAWVMAGLSCYLIRGIVNQNISCHLFRLITSQ